VGNNSLLINYHGFSMGAGYKWSIFTAAYSKVFVLYFLVYVVFFCFSIYNRWLIGLGGCQLLLKLLNGLAVWHLGIIYVHRFIFCRSVISFFCPPEESEQYLPICLPHLPTSVAPSSEAVRSAIVQLALHFDVADSFHFTET